MLKTALIFFMRLTSRLIANRYLWTATRYLSRVPINRLHGGSSLWLALPVAIAANPLSADMINTTGMKPWEVCGLCHSLDGISAMAKFPKLAGQKQAYIKKQFLDFHHRRRLNDGGQMEAITTEIAPEHLDAISHYFAALNPSGKSEADQQAKTESQFQNGRQLYHQGRSGLTACASCHDNAQDLAPWLDGQHKSYLIKQLNDFKEGKRSNDAGGVMKKITSELTTDEIEALGTYLQFNRTRNQSATQTP